MRGGLENQNLTAPPCHRPRDDDDVDDDNDGDDDDDGANFFFKIKISSLRSKPSKNRQNRSYPRDF